MGTLQNQRPRQESIESYVSTVCYTAEQIYPGKARDKMTPEEWKAAAAVMTAALGMQSADALDEQLAGFGEILQGLGYYLQHGPD